MCVDGGEGSGREAGPEKLCGKAVWHTDGLSGCWCGRNAESAGHKEGGQRGDRAGLSSCHRGSSDSGALEMHPISWLCDVFLFKSSRLSLMEVSRTDGVGLK